MKITFNGAPREIDEGCHLAALVDAVGAHREQVAVLLNGEPVPRDARSGWVLAEGDRVELLVFAGGGSP